MAESNLKLNITGDSSKLKSALNSASSQMSSFGSKMQSVGKSMTAKLTLPLVAAGAAATKLALDFDKSMTQIESLVGIASDDVKKMGEAAKKMAVDTGKSANEAAEALFFITSAGLKGADATDTLNASLKASAVGLGETKVIADLATSAMNAYGVENLNASASTDIMVAAVREGKLEASALAGAMGGVIPIASNMGVGFDEVGAAMAAMSRTGTGAAEGATQLTAILASIKKPTDGAVQSLAKMGLSTEDVQKSLSEDGLLATLEMLQSGLKQTGQDTTAIFPNIRALKGVLDLTGAGVESTRQIFDSLSNTMGATDEAFKKTSQSASFQFTKGMETMKSSLLEIGQVILPAVVKGVTKFTGFIKGLTDSFKKLSPQTQGLILTFTGILAAAGPILIIFGKIMTGLSALGPVLTVAATGFRLLTMAMVANPILAVATAIAAIGVAIYKYSQAQKKALNESLNIEQVEERLAEKREKLAEAQAKLAEGYGGQIGKNARILKEEISVLEDKAKALKKIQEAEKASDNGNDIEPDSVTAPTVNIPTTTSGSSFVVTPVLDPESTEKIKALSQEINNALVTNDAQAYEQRKADATAYYDNLISQVAEGSEKEKALKQAKSDALAQMETDEQSRILELKQQFADATGASEEEQKALELARVQAKYAELRQLAIDNNLMTAEQQAAFDIAQAEAEAAVYEEKKVRFMGFMVSQQEAAEQMQAIGSAIDGSFGAIGNSITKMFGGAESATGAFVGTLAKDALTIMGHNLKVAMSEGVAGATMSAKSFGPAAAFVLPALIAGATALISGQFAKFADGGIVSGPTMGLVGEYPGARSNPEVIAPLNKLQGMIGSSGGGGNLNVTGTVRVDGQDLLIAIERANETADRIY